MKIPIWCKFLQLSYANEENLRPLWSDLSYATTSCKRPLDLDILGGRLWEVWPYGWNWPGKRLVGSPCLLEIMTLRWLLTFKSYFPQKLTQILRLAMIFQKLLKLTNEKNIFW